MNCERISEHLADYIGCELDPQQRLAFDAHLQQCETCRAETQSLEETIATLHRLETPLAPTAGTSPPPLRLGALQPLAYAAVLFIGLGIGWWIKPSDATTAASVDRPAIREVQERPSRVHHGWLDAAVARGSEDRKASPFARNAVRLVRAISGG